MTSSAKFILHYGKKGNIAFLSLKDIITFILFPNEDVPYDIIKFFNSMIVIFFCNV